MNLQEFQRASKRTMPFNGEPSNQQEFENMLGNYAMGLVGEAVEVFESFHEVPSVFGKELGDVMHYTVGLAEILNVDLKEEPDYIVDDIRNNIKELLICAKNVSETVKKYIYHRHTEYDKQFISDELNGVLNYIYSLSDEFGNDFESILQTNINKLKTRYPEKFTVEDSIKRVDIDG